MKNHKKLIQKLNELQKEKKHKHSNILHHIHKKFGLSKKTLFYVKEYGEHSNIFKNIVKESIKVLIFASILSSIGGFALEKIKTIFLEISPLIILLPVLNGLIGNYGIVLSSRFSTMLHEEKIKKKWYKIIEIDKLFLQVIIISLITVFVSVFGSLGVSYFIGYGLTKIIALKILYIAIIDTIIIISILFLIAVISGIYIYRHKNDPNNFLIPITTSIADLLNMLILAFLVILFF